MNGPETQMYRMDNLQPAHQNSSTNPTIHKYQELVRTRQQLQFDDSQQQTKGSDTKLLYKPAIPIEMQNLQQDQLSCGAIGGQQAFFLDQPSHSHQVNNDRTLTNKQFQNGHSQHKTHSMSSKHYPAQTGASHQHSSSVKSPKMGVHMNHRPHLSNIGAHTKEDELKMEMRGGQNSQQQTASNPLSIHQQRSLVAQGTNSAHSNTAKNNNMKLLSRSHLTSANQQPIGKKQDIVNSTGKPQGKAAEADFGQWQKVSQSHPGKNSTGLNVQNRNNQMHGQQNFTIITDSGTPSITPSDSKSDKGKQGNANQILHQHNGRIVKLNQSAQKEHPNSSKFMKAQSPNSKQRITQRHLGAAGEDLLANSVKVTSATSQFMVNQGNMQHGPALHPVYQTIVKIGETNLLGGNMSKIKNQFVQKSGHLMASSYIKELDRQANNMSNAYQSDTYQNSATKHRDMSNYSNNSHYTQLTNKVGGQLKQNSSGGIIMQPQVQQNPNNAGIPIFIQRNQPWHASNSSTFNMGSGSSGIAGMASTTGADSYVNQGSKNHGQSIFLPQINSQKDQHHATQASAQSVQDQNRPVAGQSSNIKKMNGSADQHQREFHQYYNNQTDQSNNVPMIGDGGNAAAVSASASFKKSTDSNNNNNYQQELNNFHALQNNNRNNSGRANMPKGTSQMTANHTWQTASTSRKQKSTRVANALESGQSSTFSQHNKQQLAQFVNPREQSGAYELNGITLNNKTSNGIYSLAIKSAASTVGANGREDPNSLLLTDKEEAIKMHKTGDVGKQNNVTMNSNRDELSIASNLQRSMNFRRRASKEMRSNSAKWNGSQKGKNYVSTISHKSPPAQRKLAEKSFTNGHTEEGDNSGEIKQSKLISPTKNASFKFARQQQAIVALDQQQQQQQQDFKLSIQGQNQSQTQAFKEGSPSYEHMKTAQNEDMSPQQPHQPPLHVGFQFSYDLGDEPDEDDDEMNNTDGEEGEEEQDDILIVEGEDDEEEPSDPSQPNVRGKSASEYRSTKKYSSQVTQDKKVTGMGLAAINKSLNVSQEEMNTKLYSGDIYLLGGSHCLMEEEQKRDADGQIGAAGNKFSQASTTTGSEIPSKNGQLNRQASQLKKRGTGRSRKRGATKGSKHLQKIQERNSIQEAEEEETTPTAQVGLTMASSETNDKSQKELAPDQSQLVQPGQVLTDKQRKHAIRDEFLKRPPNGIITMIKSPFATRDPYIFFPYPPFLKMTRDLPRDYSRIVQYTQDQLKPYCTPGFKVSDSTHTYNCVVNALKMAGFRHVTNTTWNVLWTGLFRQGKLRNLNNQQHLNHFAGSWAIGRKDYMWRNVQRMRRLHGKAFDIAPSTYIFPEDYKRWMTDRETSNFKNMYILKPNAASCGKGIRVIGKKQNVNKRAGYIVSKYVSKPHLIKGYKYDLRLYVLVTSFDPIKIYLFKDGLVRLATVPYSTSKSSLKQRFVHLTNYSVNKKADSYVKNTGSPNKNAANATDDANDADKPEIESKLSLQQLRQEFIAMGVDYNEIFGKIKDLIVKTVFSAEQPILQCMGGNKNKNACFEIYGFDVIIDAKLRPWLLEVNVSPSLSSSSPLDKQIKSSLLSDTLYLVGFRLIDRKLQEMEKAKQNKQRLLGFESSKKKQLQADALVALDAARNSEDLTAQAINKQETVKSGAGRSRQQTNSNNGQCIQGSAFNSFISNDSNIKTDIHSAGLSGQQIGQLGQGSTTKLGSPNRRRANYAKMQPPRPWLKDQGEPSLAKGGVAANASSQIMLSSGALDGYVNLTENDLEVLADFEEEQQRKGHFELLFPTAKNVDTYRPFLCSNRRANLLLWVYLKQGAPMHHLVNHFKYLHMQSQLLQQQAGASASASM